MVTKKTDADAPVEAPAVAAPAAPAAATELRTPAEWAERLGQLIPKNPRLPQSEQHYRPEHAAADSLHGWAVHAFHFQGADRAFRLSEADYRAALVAAGQYPLVPPHAAALPFSQRDRFKDFVPAARADKESA